MARYRVEEKAVQAARKTPSRPEYLRPTVIQMIVMCIGVPSTYFLVGLPSAASLLCGATCALVPQAYFALKMRLAARESAERAARLGLAAEGAKFVISATAFALVFAVVKPQYPGLVFLGFGVLWLVQLIDGARLLRLPQ